MAVFESSKKLKTKQNHKFHCFTIPSSQIYPEMKISQLHGQEIIKPAPSEDDRVENAIEAVGMGEYDDV